MRIAPERPNTPSAAMTTEPILARGRIGRVAALAAGDALAFLIFAAIGRQSHHETSGLGAIGEVVLTALPFALGWFIVAPLAGAYRRGATATPAAMLRRTGLAWLGAWPVTLALRWIFSGMQPPVSFAIVILLANAVLLGIWRGGFAFVAARLHAVAAKRQAE